MKARRTAEKKQEPPVISVGDAVEVHGLEGARALNGRRGVVVKFVRETSRFGVRLDGDTDTKAVRAANLRRLPPPPCKVDPPEPSVTPPRPRKPGAAAPQLPEWPTTAELAEALKKLPARPVYADEGEYPDPARAEGSMRAACAGAVGGFCMAICQIIPPNFFVWSFLLLHLFGVVFLSSDCAHEGSLTWLCAIIGLHAGNSIHDLFLWLLGHESMGPWSLLVVFASALYLHSFWAECSNLPPDYITSISLFFPMFPAFNAAIAATCAEMFLEWRYFPAYKFWWPIIVLGALLMLIGQALIVAACRFADRNFWASCRNVPEEEEAPEDAIGLEIPNRRIVRIGPYRWERHPAYLGAMLWGIGAEAALCNPIMLVIVGFVLWASLLYVTMEEEQELHEEFREAYADFCAFTPCWIPLFDSFLQNASFQRELSENCRDGEGDAEPEEIEEDDDVDVEGEDAASEDDLLPTWEGVPRGGALWNRQFREPWMLG